MTATDAPQLVSLPLAWICEHPRNVRTDVGDVTALAESIAAEGILQPLVVARMDNGREPLDQYLLIAGHRRLAAAEKAGLEEVPCLIRHDLIGEADQMFAMLNENGHRADLTVVEESKAIQALLEFDGIDAATIATRTGRKKKYVTDRIALAAAPAAVVDKVAAGAATLTEALTVQSYAKKHPKLAADLEKAAGTSEFRWTLARAEQSKKDAAAQATAVKTLRAAGIAVVIDTDLQTRTESDQYRRTKSRELGQDLLVAHADRTIINADGTVDVIDGAEDPNSLIFATLAGPYTLTVQWKRLVSDTAAADKAATDAVAEQEAAAAAEREKVLADLHAAAVVRRTFLADGLRGDVDDLARAILAEQLNDALDGTDGSDDLIIIAGYVGVPISENTDEADWDKVTAQIVDKAAGLRIDQLVVLIHLVERSGDEGTLTDAGMWLPPTVQNPSWWQTGAKAWRCELAELFGYEWTDTEAALIDALAAPTED